eukprot:3417614-Rhodomonas_salina.2
MKQTWGVDDSGLGGFGVWAGVGGVGELAIRRSEGADNHKLRAIRRQRVGRAVEPEAQRIRPRPVPALVAA